MSDRTPPPPASFASILLFGPGPGVGGGELAGAVAAQGAKRTLPPPEEPAAAAPPERRRDAFDYGVAVLALSPSFDDADDDEEEEEEAFLGGEDEEELADEALSDEEVHGGGYDRDSEFDDENDTSEPGDGGAGGNVIKSLAAAVTFLGRRARFAAVESRFAAVESTAGFMRLVAAKEAGCEDNGGGGEILVDYRYTRFCASPSSEQDDGGVEVCGGGSKQHCLRYLVSGTSPVYPERFAAPLRALWSGMVAAAPVRAPPRAARVEVTVDVGILRRGDRTPARMARMCRALQALARDDDAWSSRRGVGMELRLPAPVDGGEARPAAKRRRVAGEDCPICYEVMEAGVAAWPRCSHVFHVGCLELLLLKGSQSCPMCRTTLTKPK
ncbi:hypothetical protein ACP4OV_009026 [Aristida adscensionis]